jgi:hypothetical protein
VDAHEKHGKQAHLYSQCSKSGVSTGGVVIFGVNYASTPLTMELHGVDAGSDVRVYELTAEYGPFKRSGLTQLNIKPKNKSNFFDIFL